MAMEYIQFRDVALSTQYEYIAESTAGEGVYKYLRITDIVPYFVDYNIRMATYRRNLVAI